MHIYCAQRHWRGRLLFVVQYGPKWPHRSWPTPNEIFNQNDTQEDGEPPKSERDSKTKQKKQGGSGNGTRGIKRSWSSFFLHDERMKGYRLTPCAFSYWASRYKKSCFVFQWNSGVMSSVIARINELGKNCHEGDKASNQSNDQDTNWGRVAHGGVYVPALILKFTNAYCCVRRG